MKLTSRPFSLFFTLVGFAFSWSGPGFAQDSQSTPFERRCGQCHNLDGPVALVPKDWVKRLGDLGEIDELSTEQQTELLRFFQHHGETSAKTVALSAEQRLFEEKCSLCHNPYRVFLEDFDEASLRAVVERMQVRAPTWISNSDVETILHYLGEGAPGNQLVQRTEIAGGVSEVFRVRCAACHTLERVYLTLERQRQYIQWVPIVRRMQARAPNWISDREAEQIIGYLNGLKPILPEGQIPVPVE